MLCFKFFTIMALLATTVYIGFVLAALLAEEYPTDERAIKELKKTYMEHFQTSLLLLLVSLVNGVAYVVTLYYI